VHSEIVYGDAGDASISYIHQNADIHMVALATRGRSTVGRWILGSVTEQVMHATTQPLLLLHPHEHTGVENPPISAAVYRSLIVPLDGSALDEYALGYVRLFARPTQTKVVLVSISSTLHEDDLNDEQQTPPPENEHQQAQRAAYLARQAEQLRTAAGLTVETEFAAGDSVAWVEHLTRQQRDVLVITPYRTHSDHLVLRFLHHMNIPVLLVSQERASVESGQTAP
ncbi:MAG TPA: universal stress protein, partial [Ktedonobacteraceae bacterium]|nr:universal stress protein [Ktedonobacteraceae bacterium]